MEQEAHVESPQVPFPQKDSVHCNETFKNIQDVKDIWEIFMENF